MTQTLITDGMTLNDVIDALGYSKGERVTASAGTFKGYEIQDQNGEMLGVFSASSLWSYLRETGVIR